LRRHSPDEEEEMTTLHDDEILTVGTAARLEPTADADGDDTDSTDGDATDSDATDSDATDADADDADADADDADAA
jgi:hypothetical protein